MQALKSLAPSCPSPKELLENAFHPNDGLDGDTWVQALRNEMRVRWGFNNVGELVRKSPRAIQHNRPEHLTQTGMSLQSSDREVSRKKTMTHL